MWKLTSGQCRSAPPGKTTDFGGWVGCAGGRTAPGTPGNCGGGQGERESLFGVTHPGLPQYPGTRERLKGAEWYLVHDLDICSMGPEAIMDRHEGQALPGGEGGRDLARLRP